MRDDGRGTLLHSSQPALPLCKPAGSHSIQILCRARVRHARRTSHPPETWPLAIARRPALNHVLRARQDRPWPAPRPVQGLRRPPPHRLDQHRLRRRHPQPRALLAVQQPDLRPALRHVLRQPDALGPPQGHRRQRRGHRPLRLEPRHLGPARRRQRLRRAGPARRRRVRARRPGEGVHDRAGRTEGAHGQGESGEVRVRVSQHAEVAREPAHGDGGCGDWEGGRGAYRG